MSNLNLRRTVLSLTFSLAISALSGCERGPQERLVPVSGAVTLNDQPLTRGSVSFRPDGAGGTTTKSEPYGEIKEDGTYSLFTGKWPGAPVGKYIVLVTASEPIDPNNASATPKSLIDLKYADVNKAVLRMEVEEKAPPGRYDLKLKK